MKKKNDAFSLGLLCVIALGLIISFQVYWLQEHYQLKKRQLHNTVDTYTQEFILKNTLQNILGTIDLSSLRNVSSTDSTLTLDLKNVLGEPNIKVEAEPLTSTMNPNDILNQLKSSLSSLKKVPSISITLLDDKNMRNVTFDASLLYSFLKDSIVELQNSKLVLEVTTDQNVKEIYPPNSEKTTFQESIKIIPLYTSKTTIALFIPNVEGIILLRMKSVILLSLFYIGLFGIVLYLLYNTIQQKKKFIEGKTIFTQNITHELKIPISVLSLIGEKMQATEGKHLDKDYIQQHIVALNRLSTLVEKILDFVRIGHEQEELLAESTTAKEIIETALSQMKLMLKEHQVSVDFTKVPNDYELYVDRQKMVAVFVNLLENSIKYNDRKSRITIEVHDSGKFQFISIKDNGKGIPKHYFKEVFQPYFRIPEKDLHSIKGYGVGLSYVKQIVENLHNGEIRIKESSKEGTTMLIKLPLK